MKINIDKKDIYWSYVTQVLNTGAGLLLLPIILNKVNSTELALWFIFGTITALINLIDLGFQPNIMRNITFVFSGAQKLYKEGLHNIDGSSQINYSLLSAIIITSKKIYRNISVLTILILSTLGSFYVYYISPKDQYLESNLIAWFIFIIGTVLSLYYSYFTPLLLGRGLIKEYNISLSISKIFYVFFASTCVWLGYGLIGLSFATLLSTIVNRFLANYYLKANFNFKLEKVTKEESKDIFNILWHNTKKHGLINFASFLIVRANLILVSLFLPLQLAASYGLTLQLIVFINSFSTILYYTYLPKFNNFRVFGDIEGIKTLFGLNLTVACLCFIIGCILLILIGNPLLRIIGSKTYLLDSYLSIFLGFILLLEMNHTLAATLLTTKNIVPFLKPVLVSGFIIIGLSYIILKYTNAGLLGIFFVQFLVQLSYNNWKWPLETTLELKTPYFKIFRIGFDKIYSLSPVKLKRYFSQRN